MFLYILKVSFVIGAALLFYKTVLQQESFFATNRLYLLGSILLAFALPFVSLPPLVNHQGYLAAVLQDEIQLDAYIMKQEPAPASPSLPAFTPPAIAGPKEPVGEQLQDPVVSGPVPDKAGENTVVQTIVPETQAFPWQGEWLFGLGMLYFFGVAVFALNLLVQIGSVLYSAVKSTDKIRDGDYIIVNTEGPQAPCSFFRYVFVCPDDYDFATYSQIVAHEKIHARQGHTLDMLVAELAVVVLWFNPLVWLYRREVEKNVEYQTDALLLREVPVNKSQYQLSLLRIACPNKALSITTNYNQSLLKQRIMMMNAKKSTLHGYWKYSFLVPLFFGSLLLLNEPASSKTLQGNSALNDLTIWDFSAPAYQEKEKPAKEKTKPEKQNKEMVKPEKEKPVKDREPSEPAKTSLRPDRSISRNISGPQTDISEGYWYGHQEGNEYCLELKGSRSNSTWNISRCFDKSLFQKKGNEVFVMTKETGTLQLTGNLDAEVSQGKYMFTEDAAFKKYLTANNIESNDRNLIFHLFLGDVDKQYVEFLKKNYDGVEGDRLLELAIFGISMQEYQNYIALFQKHSNKKPLIREVVEARIHGIDEEYVQEMQEAGFKELSMQKLMEAKIHGMRAVYVSSLREAGFADITMDKAIQAKIHGLTPASIKEIKQLGYGDLSLDKLMEVNIHGVDAAYIADLKSAGFDNLSLDQVIEAKIHGLSAASAKEIKGMGFKDLAFRDIMTAQIHGVDAAYVEDLKKAGLKDISMDDAVAAKIHGIDSDFIRKAKKDGYKLETVDEYVTLKIHGMALESLKKKD